MEMTGNPGSSSSPIALLDKLGWRCMPVWTLVEPFAHLKMHAQSQGLVCKAGVPVAIPHMEDVDRYRESPSEEATAFNVPLCVNCFRCQTQTPGGRADLVM